MSVWKSDEKLLIFCILNFSLPPSLPKIILFEKKCHAFDTHRFINRWNASNFVKNTPRNFNSFLSVLSGDETLRLILDIIRLNQQFRVGRSIPSCIPGHMIHHLISVLNETTSVWSSVEKRVEKRSTVNARF